MNQILIIINNTWNVTWYHLKVNKIKLLFMTAFRYQFVSSWVDLTWRKWYISILNTTNTFLLLVYTPYLYLIYSTQDSFQCWHAYFPMRNLIVPLHYFYFHIRISFCACKIGFKCIGFIFFCWANIMRVVFKYIWHVCLTDINKARLQTVTI